MFSRRGSGRSPTTSPRGRTLPWTPRPPGAGPAAASPPAQSWLVWMLAGRLTLAHLSPRAEGGAGRGRRLLLSAFGSRVLSRPLRQKSFCPREFPFNTGKRSLLAFSNVPSPPGPLRAPPPRWLSPPLSSSSSVSLSVPRLPSGSLRPDTLPRSAPCPRRTRLSRRRSSGQLWPSTRTLPRGSLCRDVFLVSCRECPPRTP